MLISDRLNGYDEAIPATLSSGSNIVIKKCLVLIKKCKIMLIPGRDIYVISSWTQFVLVYRAWCIRLLGQWSIVVNVEHFALRLMISMR